MKSSEIREIFYSYFKKKNHYRVLSSPLVPAKDPTILFTNAGMNQFKDVFVGNEKRNYNRAVSIQKCMRVSGKHNDFDEVGKTEYHHTFFEMLGNFSFGDYFKEEAIEFAWELLTEHYKFNPENLHVSVFKDDDEAFGIWEKNIGVPVNRIHRLGEKDNFWQMGDTGPCGPCSEIHVDRGKTFGPEKFSDGNKRYIEVWNLVFMQYFRDRNGKLNPLPSPSIDTGMGMERLTSLIQGVNSNYETDLFSPIKDRISEICGNSPTDTETNIAFNVIADHSRALAFLISDGVLPSNDGRGYILRRLVRRASKHGRSLGLKKTFLSEVIDKVVEIMSGSYPELDYNKEFISEVVTAEEERFNHTLSRGLKIFLENLDSVIRNGKDTIPGNELFRLSDTYGFPLDFSIDLANEKNINVDIAGFKRELTKRKEESRAARRDSQKIPVTSKILKKYSSKFSGYDLLEEESSILALFSDGVEFEKIEAGTKAFMLTESTPFYGESGGQIGDTGTGNGDNFFCRICDTKKSPGGIHIHQIIVENGEIHKGDRIWLKVDSKARKKTAVHHTSTHLLQAALREVLGLHVKQSGSYVGPDKLRFDFTHFKALSPEQRRQTEKIVNRKIRENIKVVTGTTSYESAIEEGATAIFEEKYTDIVRVVSVNGFSKELCGGTHLKSTGEAGMFKIISESSISSGIRRIEAVAGETCEEIIYGSESILKSLEDMFKVKREKLKEHLIKLSESAKKRGKEKQDNISKAGTLLKKIMSSGIKKDNKSYFINFLEDTGINDLRVISDKIIKMGGDLAVLCSNLNGNSKIVISVGNSLTKKVNASTLIKEISSLVKGNGGGRNDFAQAGGEKIGDPDDFIAKAGKMVENFLK